MDWLQKLVAWFEYLIDRRFVFLFVFLLLLGLTVGSIVLLNRQEATFIVERCGPLRWSRVDLPIPIWLERSASEWEADLDEAMKIVDPTRRLFWYRGIYDTEAMLPPPSITVTAGNFEDHGLSRLRWDVNCRIGSVHIELPGLLWQREARVRAAAHELGHALGLGHSDWETSIMYGKATSLFPFRVSESEREELVRTYLR